MTTRKSSWDKVRLTLSLVGVLYSTLALPQYLIQAMLVGALTVTVGMEAVFWLDMMDGPHFAISAMATGKLTAPQVNSDGILPAHPSIFCGVYCLIGIPLMMALTLGHFAKLLVANHVAVLESNSVLRPLTREEFDVAKHLTTKDEVIHLSDFMVLQLLRQGKISIETVELLKLNFEALDEDHSGALTLEQATGQPSGRMG